jgi:predicted ATPase
MPSNCIPENLTPEKLQRATSAPAIELGVKIRAKVTVAPARELPSRMAAAETWGV